MLLYELRKVQLQEHFMITTHDSIGPYENALHEDFITSHGVESEWKTLQVMLALKNAQRLSMNSALSYTDFNQDITLFHGESVNRGGRVAMQLLHTMFLMVRFIYRRSVVRFNAQTQLFSFCVTIFSLFPILSPQAHSS